MPRRAKIIIPFNFISTLNSLLHPLRTQYVLSPRVQPMPRRTESNRNGEPDVRSRRPP